MLLNKENRCFIKYLFTFSGIFNTLKFLIHKLYNKFFRKNDYHNYTKLFKAIFERYGCNKKFDLFKNEINSSARKYKILLATKPYLLDEKTDWNIKFDDEEDYESLHRFIWLRYLLSSEKSISTEEINFVENILFSWSNKFIHDSFDDKSLVWHPYTLSERIINIIIFYVVSNRKMPISIQKNLHFMLSILIKRLEFYNYGHGNHLINNSRALLYYALYFDDKELLSYAIQLLRYSTESFVINKYTCDGSSHYQLLLYYWFEDLKQFSNKYKKKAISELLSNYNFYLKSGLETFLIKNNKNMIFTGDISPDYPPNYLLTLLDDKKLFLKEYSLNLLYKRL